jgi:GH25 family lysozyme M1 (1,4-beta-N-acetylmuramidase)
MAFWNHNGPGDEDWDEDRTLEYEKNYRAYADEYESSGWDAPAEDAAEGDYPLEAEMDDYPLGDEEIYEESEPEEDYEDSEYDAGFDASEDLPEEEPVSYDEEYETEGYSAEEYEPAGAEPEPEITGETARMYQGEILYEEPEEFGDGDYAEEYTEESADTGEYAEEGEYEEEICEDEIIMDYDEPAREKTSDPDDDDEDDKGGFLGMNLMEKAMLILGFVAVFLAVVVGALWISKHQKSNTPAEDTLPTVVSNEEMTGVGSALDGITVIGEKGLLAALDARKAAQAALEAAEEPEEQTPTEYEEAELNTSAGVSMEGISVLKDLKIKFINSSTKKLIANVPFTLTVTDPSGKTISWTDDDQDGIIYHKNLAEGTYTIHVEKLSGEKYEKYTLPADKKVEVKGEIKYEEVEVADEVKKASEVNEAVEDTAREGAGEESEDAVKDTVTFVESTQTPTYREVLKSALSDPLKTASLGGIYPVLGTGISRNSGFDNDSTTSSSSTVTPAPSVSDNGEGNGALTLSTYTLKTYTGVNNTFVVNRKGVSEGSLSVTSSDSTVATVSLSGTTVTVTGVKAGSAAVTVSSSEDPYAACTCAVTVISSTTLLTDGDGNQLMVLEDNDYREATYADYFNSSISKFYVVGEIKYTGWQNIDGYTYYYTADGKAVTGSQIIQGMRYEFNSDGKLHTGNGVMGIDVSKWNGNIDWNKVKNAGVNYVIIRVGYRGSSQGALIDDSRFAANIKGATAAGLKVGVYFFSQAVDEVEAVYEASMVLDRISGYKISLPVFIDVEASGGRGDSIDKATRTAVCKAFCATIASKGYTAGVYSNKTWLTSKIDVSQLSGYKIWLAQYATEVDYSGRYDMWQYTAKGTINGISGNVDLNLYYGNY